MGAAVHGPLLHAVRRPPHRHPQPCWFAPLPKRSDESQADGQDTASPQGGHDYTLNDLGSMLSAVQAAQSSQGAAQSSQGQLLGTTAERLVQLQRYTAGDDKKLRRNVTICAGDPSELPRCCVCPIPTMGGCQAAACCGPPLDRPLGTAACATPHATHAHALA